MNSDFSQRKNSASASTNKEVRINDLCRELGVKAKVVVELLPRLGVTEKKTHSSYIGVDVAEKVRRHFAKLDETIMKLDRVLLEETVAQPTLRPSGVALAKPPMHPLSSPPTELSIAAPSATTGTSRSRPESFVLQLPRRFSFHRGFLDFDYIFDQFDWTLKEIPVFIDLSTCESANYQALALLIQYAWFLTLNGCRVTFKYGVAGSGATGMLTKMGALSWLEVLKTDGKDFGTRPGKMLALRRRSDVQNTINTARRAIQNYNVGFPDYLSYIVSELLYNSTEHGCKHVNFDSCQIVVPSIFQFGRYPASDRLVFLFSDLGVGIKAHIERAYPPFPSDQDAIIHALRPNVSGTFSQQSSAYSVSNNAGMGLTYSSLMLKRLRGDMYIVSHNGMAHISPEDVTTRSLKHAWPGTFVLIELNISDAPKVSLEDMLREVRVKAETELSEVDQKEQADRYVVNVQNYFGKWAEDKDAAINLRDRYLIPAIGEGKKIDLDFRGVETAPHSLLNALLATPVKRLGVRAYQRIRVYNATGSIHEIIQAIFESNLPELK